MRYGVWCECWGQLGYSQGWLRVNDVEYWTVNKEEAVAKAQDLNNTERSPYSQATFMYSVRETNNDFH